MIFLKMFRPYKNRIEIKPYKADSILPEEDRPIIECGEVVSVGEGVDGIKIGDIIFFDQYGCTKTCEKDGIIHYTVYVSDATILGKEMKEESEVTLTGSTNGG